MPDGSTDLPDFIYETTFFTLLKWLGWAGLLVMELWQTDSPVQAKRLSTIVNSSSQSHMVSADWSVENSSKSIAMPTSLRYL